MQLSRNTYAAWLSLVLAGAGSCPTQPSRADETARASVVIDSSAELSAYADSDHVSVLSPSIALGARTPSAGWNIGTRYLVDIVSAASVDIVATASRRWSEVRHQWSGHAAFERDGTRLGAAASVSVEPDYVAATASLLGGFALAANHVSLALRYDLGNDRAGRSGTPFRVFEHTLWKHGPALGATFVLDDSSVLFTGIDASFERGDQAKPYRYVATFDAHSVGILENGASIETVDRLRGPEAPSERLPLARSRAALTLRYMRHFGRAVLRAEERFYADTWGLLASSSDARCTFLASNRLELGASLRLHLQRGVSFWRRAYVVDPETAVLPALRTGDRELGPLWTSTLGLDVRYEIGPPALKLRVAGIRTEYLDTLYIAERLGLFTSLAVEGSFD